MLQTRRPDSAKEQLQSTIDRVIEVLRTIRSAEDIEKNRSSLREILLTRFDFAAMAQKSLGNRWKDLNGHEEEFVSAFTDFVEHSYMSTLGSYRGEKVVYDRDRGDGESAEIDTRVVGGRETPIKIEYKLHLAGGEWKVYDAVIDDVSIVGNYRSQFARILQTASLDELIQKLRARQPLRNGTRMQTQQCDGDWIIRRSLDGGVNMWDVGLETYDGLRGSSSIYSLCIWLRGTNSAHNA